MERRRLLFCLLLALLPLLVYLPTLDHELIWDSKPIILENDLLQKEFSLAAPFRSGYWATTSQRHDGGYDYYRPLTILSFMMEKAAWGLSPLRLRLVNLLLFIAALFALYLFLRRQGGRPGTAEAAVLLFALFPLHVDNIVWVVGRCDLLMLLFGVLSLLLFDRFLEKRSPLPGMLALASFALALLSKEAALFFLPLFPLHEIVRRRRVTLSLYIPPLLAAAGFWLLKSSVIARGGFPIRPFPSIQETIQPALGALGYYFRSLAFPFRYDMFLPLEAVQGPLYLAAGSLFALWLALTPFFFRRRAGLAAAWFWIAPFLAGALLMIYTPIHPFSISTRYLMVPAIGWTWLLAHWLAALRPVPRNAALAALLALSAAAILASAQKYGNETKFWAATVASRPHESFFLYKYGGQLLRDGDFIRGQALLRRALASRMKSSTAVSVSLQLADIEFHKGRYEECLGWLERAGSLPHSALQAGIRRQWLRRVHLARNDRAGAEALVEEEARSLPAAESARRRIELLLAFADWPQALRAAAGLEAGEAEEWSQTIGRERSAFLRFDPGRQAAYFIARGNFAAAWERWPGKEAPGIPEQLQAAKLAFLAGLEAEGRQRVGRLLERHGGDFKVLNAAGNLLFDLRRGDEALALYERSLRLRPGQPALRERIAWIRQPL